MPDDSCDVALEEYNRRELELADAFSTMVALAAASAVSVFVFLAAIGILVLTLGTLGTPTAPLGWTMLVSVAVVAALSGAVAVFGMVALVSAYLAWDGRKPRDGGCKLTRPCKPSVRPAGHRRRRPPERGTPRIGPYEAMPRLRSSSVRAGTTSMAASSAANIISFNFGKRAASASSKKM